MDRRLALLLVVALFAAGCHMNTPAPSPSPTLAQTVAAVAFSPDGKWLVTCSADYTATVWDTATRRPARTLSRHSGSLTCAAFSRDGSLLATGSRDTTAILWTPPDT